MGSDNRRIENQPLQVGVLQGDEDQLPIALGGPTVESPPVGVSISEAFGQVTTRSTGPGNSEDGIKE